MGFDRRVSGDMVDKLLGACHRLVHLLAELNGVFSHEVQGIIWKVPTMNVTDAAIMTFATRMNHVVRRLQTGQPGVVLDPCWHDDFLDRAATVVLTGVRINPAMTVNAARVLKRGGHDCKSFGRSRLLLV